MAQNVIINGVTYNNVPEVDIPKAGGGTAKFTDTSGATLANGSQIRNGVTAYGPTGAKITGTMAEKAAQTYTPTTSDQIIAANQYLIGAQTVKGDANLQGQNILRGVSIFGVAGTLTTPNVSQDATTKVLSIS